MQKKTSANFHKLLSHRTRGFAEKENSIEGLEAALKYQELAFIETDMRLSKDGVVHIHHDPYFKANGQKLYLKNILSKDLVDNYGIVTLETYIKTIVDSGNTEIGFVIDIKDFGVEKAIFDLVQKYKVANELYFITWIPETIYKLSELGFHNIYWSYYPTTNRFFSWIFKTFPKLSFKVPFTFLHLTGVDFQLKDNMDFAVGYQRVIVTHDIPEKIRTDLLNTNGGVCLEYGLVSDSHLRKVKKLNLNVMLFQLRKELDFWELQDNNMIDIIISDEAKMVLDQVRD